MRRLLWAAAVAVGRLLEPTLCAWPNQTEGDPDDQ